MSKLIRDLHYRIQLLRLSGANAMADILQATLLDLVKSERAVSRE